MGLVPLVLLIFVAFVSLAHCQVQDFVSIDCGGNTNNYRDPRTGLEWISDAEVVSYGKSTEVENPKGDWIPYRHRRDFPVDGKYCYNLKTQVRRRYIVRATFLYGSQESRETYPNFQLYLDTTKWTTVNIYDASRVFVKEMIIMAPSESIDVCLCCATTGVPFISTLELRPLNMAMYVTTFEDSFFLEVATRVNFGALSEVALRYPDDPYDRIWESDLAKRQNFLVGVAPGTERINTSKNVYTNTKEYPPVKVMQTAVVGTNGLLSYRLNLEDFPANARAYAYFAEIQDLGPNETRKFKLVEPYEPDYSNAIVNIVENANGSYSLYEPSYMNISLQFVLSFAFKKTPDSTRGPLLNAIEISRYVKISSKTDRKDVNAVNALRALINESALADQGDPCLPVAWPWVTCSSAAPPRITKIVLSGKNINGELPPELNNMDNLTELWLDGNLFTGLLPDLRNLINLQIMHIENNRLTGLLPPYLGSLPSLHELYIENNSFNGEIPGELLSGKVKLHYEGNPGLHRQADHKMELRWILGVCVGVALALLLLGSLLLLCIHRRKNSRQKRDHKGSSMQTNTKPSTIYSSVRWRNLLGEGISHYIMLSELEEATGNFSKKIGKGSFGSVFYGRMKDGKEVAVKIMADSSSHRDQQFATEVALLSRIHHRNLVPLIGYCEEEYQRILVYEYMHNGTLRDHIHDSIKQKQLDWLSRLKIAEDAAKGLEYLHTGCNPSIIHRDVKTSNILLDAHMRAKVSDFGLSRQTEEDLTHISSVAQGTVGYLDPEYYGNQQLTEKSDVYSFGVVLLELISGRKPVSTEDYGADWNMIHWARSLIRKGDVLSMVDPVLAGCFKIESIWRIAEIAILCVEQHGFSRPRMQEVIQAIQDAIKIQKESEGSQKLSPTSAKGQSSRKTLLTSFLEIESPDLSKECIAPPAR